VENGYVWGTLSRIDARTGRVRVVWRRATSSVQYVAAGAGSIWALIGSERGAQIARFALDGRLLRVWRIPGAGRMAADDSGCWVSTGRRLLWIDPSGRVHRVVRAPLGDVATGGGSVWLPLARSVLQVDERTGALRTIHTRRLGLGGFQHDLAVGGGSLWALSSGRMRSTLIRLDARSGRRTGSLSVRGIGDAVVARPGAVWVGTVIAPAGRSASGYALSRLDPRTLRRTLLVRLPG
jgi:hypothetical protein